MYACVGLSKEATVTVKEKEVVEYMVTFKAETGGRLTDTTSMHVKKGTKVPSVPTVKTANGYTFNGWYQGTKKVEPKTISINGNTTFVAKFTKKAPTVQTTIMYRLYNPNNHEHFYTSSTKERDHLVKIHWGNYEGPAWKAPANTGNLVYRLYNKGLRDHFYTANWNEVKNLTKNYGWKYEGVAWYGE